MTKPRRRGYVGKSSAQQETYAYEHPHWDDRSDSITENEFEFSYIESRPDDPDFDELIEAARDVISDLDKYAVFLGVEPPQNGSSLHRLRKALEGKQ